MKYMILTKGYYSLVDDEDYEFLSQWKWSLTGPGGNTLYAARGTTVNGKQKTILMHRVLIGAKPGQDVDHKDGNGLNNQKSNLRICSKSQNLCNQKLHCNNKAGIKGVRQYKNGKWQARIQINGRSYHIGYFNTSTEASRAYNEAALRLHKEFAKIYPI